MDKPRVFTESEINRLRDPFHVPKEFKDIVRFIDRKSSTIPPIYEELEVEIKTPTILFRLEQHRSLKDVLADVIANHIKYLLKNIDYRVIKNKEHQALIDTIEKKDNEIKSHKEHIDELNHRIQKLIDLKL